MSRYFYTETLAAAWMCQRFGMTFESKHGERYGTPAVILAGFSHPRPHHHRIHLDSLPLLHPQPRDIVFWANWTGGIAWDEVKAVLRPGDDSYPDAGDGSTVYLMDGGDHCHLCHVRRINQRDGQPFFWPESEAT